EDNTPFIRRYLAKALCEKAHYFTQLAKKENSLAAYAFTLYDELLQKFSNETDTEIQKIVKEARENCKKSTSFWGIFGGIAAAAVTLIALADNSKK
ncbi:MAG: hypothetical protein IIW09_00575, partial [Acetobacter sp.]|nr:hypothetical protein [Acetobacter sp.]